MKERFEVVDDVGAAFAREVESSFDNVGRHFSIALSGGSTATTCYEHLKTSNVDWSRTIAIWGDERCVGLDHEDANYLLARKALFDWVSPLEAVHPMAGGQSADAYEKIVADLLPLDVVHLGMGDDGHVASLFPGSETLDVTDRLVVDAGDEFHKHPRLTLTYPAIEQSKKVIITVTGANKASMLAKVRSGEDFPATRVRSQEVVWFVDSAAASLL